MDQAASHLATRPALCRAAQNLQEERWGAIELLAKEKKLFFGRDIFSRRYEAWRSIFIERKKNRMCFLDKER